MENKGNGRASLMLLANAVIWAAAMLAGAFVFAGEAWIENALPWMALAFILINGALAAAMGKQRPHC